MMWNHWSFQLNFLYFCFYIKSGFLSIVSVSACLSGLRLCSNMQMSKLSVLWNLCVGRGAVSVILLQHNKSSQSLVASNKNIYFCTVSMGQNSGQGVGQVAVIWRLDWGKVYLQVPDLVVGRTGLLAGHWTEFILHWCWQKATFSFLWPTTLHREARNMAACFIRVAREKNQRENEGKAEVILL